MQNDGQFPAALLTRWVRPSDFVADSWVADFYDPDFLALECELSKNRGKYISLGELLRGNLASRLSRTEQPSTDAPVRWLATIKERKIVIHPATKDLASASELPMESILLPCSLLSREHKHPIHYWKEDIWGGVGAANPNLIVLSSLSSASIAWISWELSQPYCQKQIQRLGNQSTIQRTLLVSDLLRIRIKRLDPDEQQFATDLVLRELRTERERSSLPFPDESTTGDREYLPGATFEERRRHFEERVLPNLDARPLAFVEASTMNRSADLFAVRDITGPTNHSSVRVEFADRRKIEDEKWWRDWYWQGDQNDSLVCHALVDGAIPVLPGHLFERLLPSLIGLSPKGHRADSAFKGWKHTREGRVQLPSPAQLEELVGLLTSGSADITDIIKTDGLLPNFMDASRTLMSDSLYEAFELLKQIFRPLLLIRLVRDGSPIGVYILAGNQQFDDPDAEKQRLELIGAQLLRTLQPQDDLLSEVTRRESLRRLSWFAHQINGPIGRADAALTDVLECLEKNPQLAAQLVPDEATANRMAAMAKQPIEKYQMQTRLNAAARAIQDLRQVNYRIRQLRRVQGDIKLVPSKILTIIKNEIGHAHNSLPNLRICAIDLTDHDIMADEHLLNEAFQEIFNNTIREFKTRKTEEPTVFVTISQKRDRVLVSIRDNGLPALVDLIKQPFEEDSSTYSQQGKGSGLGLTVVREIILRHGGKCDLSSNRDEDGERIPGVTFTCDLPLANMNQTTNIYDEL